MRALARGGVDAVRVEVLARELAVTKGSFYGRFRDRQALLDEMLATWARTTTRGAEAAVQQKTSDPRERIRLLLELALEADRDDVPGGRFELAVREWAVSAPDAAEALRGVDRDRMRTLADLYRATGMGDLQADAYAYLLYAFTIGSNRIAPHLDRRSLETLRGLVAAILTP